MTRRRIAVLALAGSLAAGAPAVAHRVAVAAPTLDRAGGGCTAAPVVPTTGEPREASTSGEDRPGS